MFYKIKKLGVYLKQGGCMHKGRLEAFSDGVIAIIITIMVLEIKVPHEANIEALIKLIPVFISYVISFVYVGIYWNNHHHLFQTVKEVDGRVLWANLFLLFWLSLIPFASGWMGENHSHESVIHQAIGNKIKERVSLLFYIIGLVLSFWFPLVAFGLFTAVAIIWLLPDRRIEKAIRI